MASLEETLAAVLKAEVDKRVAAVQAAADEAVAAFRKLADEISMGVKPITLPFDTKPGPTPAGIEDEGPTLDTLPAHIKAQIAAEERPAPSRGRVIALSGDHTDILAQTVLDVA